MRQAFGYEGCPIIFEPRARPKKVESIRTRKKRVEKKKEEKKPTRAKDPRKRKQSKRPLQIKKKTAGST
jgi:hypothetical protein